MEAVKLPFDLFKRPVYDGDEPAPEADEPYDAFKAYVLNYCVRPVIPTVKLTGTCTTFCILTGALNSQWDRTVEAGTVTYQQWWTVP